MKRIITVCEYDSIPKDYDKVCNNKRICVSPSFKESSDLLDEKKAWDVLFDELSEFVLKEKPENDTDDDPKYFFRFGQEQKTVVIKALNYVGLVQLKSGSQIQILPKIDYDDETSEISNDYPKTKRMLLTMLDSLINFNCKHLNVGALDTNKLNLFEFFIRLFAFQVEEIVRKGIKSSYINLEDNVPYYKGKLLVSQHIRYNLTHAERFYVSYDEFNVNRPENCLLKAALIYLLLISTDISNKKKLHQLLMQFELVEPSVNYQADFAKIIIDRTTQAYEKPLNWAEVFLLGKSFISFAGKTEATSLLFPMEKLFEAYIAKMARFYLHDCNVTVQKENNIHSLFNRRGDDDKEKQTFGLQPDIVLNWEDENRTVIVDTKWKRLKKDASKNYGISQADMYQMYAYSKEYQTPYVCLVYPMTAEFKDKNNPHNTIIANYKNILVGNKPNEYPNVHVYVLMVDLSNDDGVIDLFNDISQRIK